ncbi:MAG: AAA family ATPase [Nanoarchaeota archaeon]|nr:AAA family ATPase [Nanoarchaeota archaeon]MBU1445229.1 AAA family ATPase [Nanoarchaeota archaeon]MBU2406483.1 AAA family ATPase [Nanoarchaeota archaeon]MBU2420399.1 AAA family ATPase [Nanoarchaeota archaeon]MBU2475177.1 AAA family ATPase [Nanoarchaeota archaeon]
MFYQKKNDDMENTPIDTKKYAEIVSEIERFIELKKKKPTTIKGTVEKVDLSNNILTIKLSSDNRPDFSRGSLVLIKEEIPGSIEIRATIKEFYNSYIKLDIETDPSMFEDKKVIIDTEKTNVILERLKRVIDNIKEGKINSDNIRILDVLVNNNKPKYSQKKVPFISRKLNDDQKKGVMNSIKAEDFHLIIGPPGTGKTYVIEELIKQFVKRKQKTLITAWTNLAVDNIIKRLSKKDTKNLVRIGPIDEVDSEIKKFSIFEKMTKHKEWKEVERQIELRNGLFKLIPKIKEERDLAQKSIDQNENTSKILNSELDNYNLEIKKYEELLLNSINNSNLTDISPITNELAQINEKSGSCLSLSRNILQMNNLQSKMPDPEQLRILKKSTRSMKFFLVGKKVSSLFFHKKEKEIKKLKRKYEKNKRYLDEISKLETEYDNLKKSNEAEFNKIYPDENGSPDKDALNFEYKSYRILEDKYFPALKEQENSNIKTSKINQEVYNIYLDSLKKKSELLDVKIEGVDAERDIQINYKKDRHKEYINLIISLDLYKRNIDKLKKSIISDIIDKADIIAATAISSCHPYLDNINFDIVIMDESSQVASFMSLLPLLKCKKFILVGDNKQLQPIEEKDISPEMNLSIFNRLFEMYPKDATFLPVQYRMHKTIAQIASEIFYEGKLRTSKQAAERILNLKVGKHLFLNPKIPVVFIDTSKVAYYEDEVGFGCSNTQEAKYVAYLVSLFIKKGIKMKDIAVITPYVKQNLLIREFLDKIKIKDVEVNTVHKFQGREKDIIIMSFAKSKKYAFSLYKLRFIENNTLVNVAITRARKKLILVGNSKTLAQSQLLNKVISKIGKENSVFL